MIHHRLICSLDPAILPTANAIRAFFIDRAPPGLPIPGDILMHNRAFLERRLRDLGLLTGVNDAERMKRLRPRFEARAEGIVS